MGENLTLVSVVVYLLCGLSSVQSGRLIPLGMYRIESSKVSDDSGYKSSSFEDYFNGLDDNDDAAYITDTQIDELKTQQEKITRDQEIYHVDPRCPKFDGDCSATPCASDNDCGNKICCFNGCVQACVNDMSPPIAVDWIPKEHLFATQPPFKSSNTITIPGGCKISTQQENNLGLFLKYGHVSKCLCWKDDVVCYVRKNLSYPVSSEDFEESDEEAMEN